MKKIAILELGGSHDECILSQLYALKSDGWHITFIGTKDIIDRNDSWKEFLNDIHVITFPMTAIGDFQLMRSINSYLKKSGIQKVVINTAQGGHIRNLCLTAPAEIEFIGIIHTLRKFQGSFTQKLINRKIKKYFVLNDYFLDKVKAPDGIEVRSFYPLRFPNYSTENFLKKSEGEIWVVIIGGVENRRKDLQGSVNLISKSKNSFRFIFLGKSDYSKQEVKAFINELKEKDALERVVLFDHFVDPKTFDAYLKNADLIWPMVHPDTPSADQYFRNQISGAMNVSFAYKIPMLVHRSFQKEWLDLKCSIAYEVPSFESDLDNGLVGLDNLKACISTNKKFDPNFQEEEFLNFVVK